MCSFQWGNAPVKEAYELENKNIFNSKILPRLWGGINLTSHLMLKDYCWETAVCQKQKVVQFQLQKCDKLNFMICAESIPKLAKSG